MLNWAVKTTFADAGNVLPDKTLLSDAITSVVSYLQQFVHGSGTLNLTVDVSATPTGRFAGGGAVFSLGQPVNGIQLVAAEAMRELTTGKNFNGDGADLTIYIDPGSSYFSGLWFNRAAFEAPAAIPANQTDGQSVLLHEIMHGLGIGGYRLQDSGQYADAVYRSVWDSFVQQQGDGMFLAMPTLASYGLHPLRIDTSSTSGQKYYHLTDKNTPGLGYLDDLMNSQAFYLGHRYALSQIDLMLLRDLGYDVTIPADLPLSYSGLLPGSAAQAPTLTGAGAAMQSNQLQVSGTALAGDTVSIMEHNQVIGTALAGADGRWSATVMVDPGLSLSSIWARDADNASDSAALALARASGDLQLSATASYSKLLGGAGNDRLFSLGGAQIDGGAGTDTASFRQAASAYTVSHAGSAWTVMDKAQGAQQDVLVNVERLQFADGALALDVAGVAGQAYRIYQAAFDRTPDSAGLGYWISVMDRGVTLAQVADSFMHSPEFIDLYGAHPSAQQMVMKFYANVLHRAPDQAGYDYWLGVLTAQPAAAADVLASFSDSPENQAALVGVMSAGMAYTPFS